MTGGTHTKKNPKQKTTTKTQLGRKLVSQKKIREANTVPETVHEQTWRKQLTSLQLFFQIPKNPHQTQYGTVGTTANNSGKELEEGMTVLVNST